MRRVAIALVLAAVAALAVPDPPPATAGVGGDPATSEVSYVLRRWAAALAGRDADRATVLAIGDSITEGRALADIEDRWVDRLARLLRERFPTAGLGTGGGRGYLPTYYADGSASPPLPEPTRTGTVTERTSGGPGQRSVELGTGAAVTYRVRGTSVRVFHETVEGAAPLTVTIDATAPTTVPTAVPGQTDRRDAWVDLALPAPAGDEHTVVVARGSGGTVAPRVSGLWAFDGDEDRGVHVVDAGHGGWQASHFATGARGASAMVTDLADWVPATGADVALVAVGTNEWVNRVPVETYAGHVRTIVAELRAEAPRLPVLLIGWRYPWDEAWGRYAAALAALSDELADVAFLDFGRAPTIPTLDGVHPDPTGHAVIAQELVEVLASGRAVPDDTTGPVVRVDRPQAGDIALAGERVVVGYRCDDGVDGSRTARCDGDVPTGGELATGVLGPQVFTVTAVDHAGNETVAQVPYQVVARPRCQGRSVTVDIGRGEDPTVGDDVILGTPGNDRIEALGGDDVVCAGSGRDVVDGGTGADRLAGGADGDELVGGHGPDRLDGGAGRDRCRGGRGQDGAVACEVRRGIP